MFNVVFYEDEYGYSELNDELLMLSSKSLSSKDARIQFNQIVYCIELLKKTRDEAPR